MPLPKPKLPPAPQPTKIFFDPYNTSSTGHQRDPSRLAGTTSWRESRSYKLSHQLSDVTGAGGKRHLSDLVGAGSENYGKDGRKDNGDWEVGAPGLREKGWQDIRGLIGGSKKRSSESPLSEVIRSKKIKPNLNEGDQGGNRCDYSVQHSDRVENDTCKPSHEPIGESGQFSQIFRGLTIYLNGSTAPLVSDLRLKQLFVQHGGNASIALGRRTVTHVILGEGYGGGLASGKIQKEISTVSGKGIKYVTAQWVMDSVEKGTRQPEARYVPVSIGRKIGGSGQTSVKEIFGSKN